MNRFFTRTKRGVALVTVLLFMLVATIAATATYKWLNSEGWSSASRMQIREAEQAAQAGLVAARSWMSFHGNETGAIIGQYLKEHKPILLSNITGNINEKQADSVWVTGVDVSRTPYTIKLVSKGFSRNKLSTYQKTAIFSVNGLYKTKLPSTPALMEFNDALYAGSAGGVSLDVSSGIVNGDVMLNTSVDVPGRLIVTGNVNVNSDTHINDLYVYGDLYSCTNLNVTGNTYVRKKLYVNGSNIFGEQKTDGTISGGNVYADQGVDMTGTGTTKAQCSTGPGTNFTIYGNLTTNGDILTPRHNAGTAYTVKGNVVVNNGGRIVFPNINDSYSYTDGYNTITIYDSTVFDGQSYSVNFLGNVFLSGGINNDGFHAKYRFAPNFVLGSTGKQVYVGKPIYRVSSAEGLIDQTTDYYNYWVKNDVVTNTPHFLTYKSKYGGYVTTSGLYVLAGNVFCNNPNCAPSDNNDDNFWNNAAFYEDCATHEDKCTKEGPYYCDGFLGPWNDCYGQWKRVCEEHFDLAYSCKVKRNDAFFQVNGTYTTTAPDPTEWEANKMEEVTSSIDTKAGSGCSGPHIKEPIQFNEAILENAFVFSKDNKSVCDIPYFWEDGEAPNWPKLEQCYNAASRNGKLYKNEWLVVKFDGQYQFHNVSATETVSKKYIMIFENTATVSLPKTTNDGMAFIYLTKGGTLAFSTATDVQRNYFIYGDGDIYYNGGSSYPVNGTFFLKNCHAITGVNTITVNYNESLMKALSDHDIICANDDTDRCDGTGSGASSSGTPGSDGSYDEYYVAVSPQLHITIESEYKHKENGIGADISSNVTPSYIVLPRIIYLPKKPKGSLSDYYDVVPLNGANITKNAASVSCNTSIPISSKFSLSEDPLSSGIHKCIYENNTYGNIPFYVVVGNEDENPTEVKFVESSIEISKGGAAVPVKISVNPDAEGKPIKVDVYQYPAPDENWIITGQTPTKVDFDGGKYYTITLIPDQHQETEVVAFQVRMNESAASGGVGFQLRTPCDGCIIKAPPTAYIISGGSFEVHRKSVSDYCSTYSDDPECASGGKYYNIINHGISCESGNLLDDPWITARGIDCQPIPTGDPNSDWSCNVFINPDVHLESLTSGNVLCDITVPHGDNNRILSAAEDSKDNYLYASATRKMYNLHINLSGRTSTSSRVLIAQASSETATSGEPYETCGSDKPECDIPVIAGYKYFLTYEEGGSDNFSNWKCTGLNCPSATHTANSYDLVITTNNTITATFNDVDKHCLYEDFAEDDGNQKFAAFCGSNTSTRCIDTCKVDDNGNRKMNCSISQSQNWKGQDNPLNPEWVMVYDNSIPECAKRSLLHKCLEYKKSSSNQLLAPKINSDGSIYANASSTEDYEDEKFGTQSVILSTKEAGPNGVLTSVFTTKIYSKILGAITSIFGGDEPTFANSGFIFRSNANATEYFSISVYGDGVTGGATGNINVMLCKVTTNPGSLANPNQCKEKKTDARRWLKDPITELTKITMALTVDNSTVSVDLTLDHNIIGDGERKITFNLDDEYPSSNNFNDDAHSYIGMKLTSNKFRIHDISWQSEKFANDCWDYPKLVCSFKANYLGGIVPQNEDVSPWWSFSSFANDKFSGCTVDFYYNGCDNNSSYSNTFSWDHWSSELQNHLSCRFGSDKIGAYWEEGSKLSSSTYNFSKAGPHGFTHSTIYHPLPGKAMDAKVIAVCPKGVEIPSSLSVSQSCGDFIVGKVKLCEKNYDILENTHVPAICSDSCSFAISAEEGINLRDASAIIKIDNAESKNLRIYLQDKSGKQSVATPTSVNGELTIDVNNVANTDGFDPQSIKALNIKIVDGGLVSVQSALTTCPYAVNVKSCSASYTGSAWEISAEVENATACDIEVPSNSNADKSKLSGLCGSTFRLPEEGLLNVGGVYEFAVIATRTTSDGKTVTKRQTCGATTVSATTITCTPLTNDNTTVNVGEGVPSLTTTFSNCPNNLCSYEVSLGTEKRSGTVSSGTSITHTFTGINTSESPLTANQLYNFGIKVILDENHHVTSNSCGFYVVSGSDSGNNSSDSGTEGTDPKSSSSATTDNEVNFTCPETITIQNGEYIYLNPQDITGCKEGCKYQVSTSAGVDVDHSSYDYENIGGQIGPINGAIIGDVDPKSTEVSQNYTLELTNKQNKKHSCNIPVKIQKPCCSCECADKSHIGNTGAPAGKNTEPLCAYGERVLEINENYDKHSIKINGKDVSYCGTELECRNQLPPKINNGYFMEIPVGGYVAGRVSGGNLATACATSSGGTESTTSITTETSNGEEHLFNIESGSYTLNHNCRNNGGWWYICTGSSITINGSTYVCGGTQYSTWTQPPSGNQLTYEPPPTGSTLEIPSGTQLKKFGCAK